MGARKLGYELPPKALKTLYDYTFLFIQGASSVNEIPRGVTHLMKCKFSLGYQFNTLPSSLFENIDIIFFSTKNVEIRTRRDFPFAALRLDKGVKKLRIHVVPSRDAKPGDQIFIIDLQVKPHGESKYVKKKWTDFDIPALISEKLSQFPPQRTMLTSKMISV